MLFQYQSGTSWFHRLDPLSKFIWLACISALCILYSSIQVQLALFSLVIVMGWMAANLTLRKMWHGIRYPFWFGVPYFLLQLIFVTGKTTLLQLGNFVLTEEALMYASAVTLRLLTLVLSSLLFVTTTNPRDLVASLSQQAHVPYRFAFGISIALRFVPLLKQEAMSIQAAQQLRGMSRPQNLLDKLRWRHRFLFALFVGAIRRVEGIANAMEMKGFGMMPLRTWRTEVRMSGGAWLLVVSSISLTISSIIAKLWF